MDDSLVCDVRVDVIVPKSGAVRTAAGFTAGDCTTAALRARQMNRWRH